MSRPDLTKSKFLSGLQCLKAVWWSVHEPDALELEVDEGTQVVFDQGHLVGTLAQERFPGGVLIDNEPWQYQERCEATRAALQAGARAIYEASFSENGVFVAVDILERNGNGFNVIEVKSTTRLKPEHIRDVAIQLHVLQAAGINIRQVEVMHLNRKCRYPNLSNLFTRVDVTNEAKACQSGIPGHIQRMRNALAGRLPNVAIGDHCDTPYECPFMSRCWPEKPEHPISTLYKLGKKSKQLVAAGIETIHDLPADYPLKGIPARQVRSVKSGQIIVEPRLGAAIKKLKTPIAFLDFESVAFPIPIWNGCAPYDSVAVQMSCHVLGTNGQLEHHEFLAKGAGDPRPALAQAIIRSCRGARTVLAYNASFERGCIENMAQAVPSCRTGLQDVVPQLVDLLPIVRNYVYHPDFNGSFSIKSVLPALVPGLGYDDLVIGDGFTAQSVLERLLLDHENIDPQERRELRKQLLAYCERDTFAMVELLEVLQTFA